MAYNLGEAYLRVFPNMEKFHNRLLSDDQFKKAKNEQIEIPVRLDRKQLEKDFDKLDQKIRDYESDAIELKVDIDSTKALTELREISKVADELDGKVVDVKVVIDDSRARNKLNEVHQTAQDEPIKMATELDETSLNRAQDVLNKFKSDNELLHVYVAVNRNHADEEMDDFRKKHEQIAIRQKVEMIQPTKLPSFGGGMGAEAREMVRVANGAIARQWTAVSLVPDILSKMNEQLDAGIDQIYTPYLRMVQSVYNYAARPIRSFQKAFREAKTFGDFVQVLGDRFEVFSDKVTFGALAATGYFLEFSKILDRLPGQVRNSARSIGTQFSAAGQTAATAMAKSADDIRMRLMYLGEAARKNMEPIRKQMSAASGALSVALLGSANRFSRSVSGVGSDLSRTFSGLGDTLNSSMSNVGAGVSSRLSNTFRDAVAASILHLGVLDAETGGKLSGMVKKFQSFSNKARASVAGFALAANIQLNTLARTAQTIPARMTQGFDGMRDRAADVFENLRVRAATSLGGVAAAGLLNFGVLRERAEGVLGDLTGRFSKFADRASGSFDSVRGSANNMFRGAVASGMIQLGVLNNETDGALSNMAQRFRRFSASARNAMAALTLSAGLRFGVLGEQASDAFNKIGGRISNVFGAATGVIGRFNSQTAKDLGFVWNSAIGDVNRFGSSIKGMFDSLRSGGSMKLAFSEIGRGIDSVKEKFVSFRLSSTMTLAAIGVKAREFQQNFLRTFTRMGDGVKSRFSKMFAPLGNQLSRVGTRLGSQAGKIFGPIGNKISQHMAKGMSDSKAWKGVQRIFGRLNGYISGFTRIAVGSFAKVGGVIMKSLLPALGAAAAGIALMAGQVAIVGVMALLDAIISVVQGAALMVPALVAAAGISFAALKIGLEGVGEAVGSAFSAETAEEFEEAIADLPASVQAIARSFREFKPAMDEMKSAVQDNLLAGLAPGISAAMTNLFPTISTGLQNIATEWNGALKMALDELASDDAQRGLSIIMDNTTEAARNMQPVIANLMNAFGALAEMGSNHLPAIGTWATDITQSFKEWVESLREIDESTGMSKFDTMIQSAVESARLLGAIFGGLFGTIGNMASAMGEGGGGMMAAWASGMQALNESTKEGTENYAAMVQFARDAGDAASQLADIISPAFGIIASIASTLMRVASGAIPGIATGLEFLKTGLAPLENIAFRFGENLGNAVSALGPALGRIGDVLAPLLSGLSAGIEALFVTAGPAIERLIISLAPVAEALMPVFESVGTAIGDIFTALEPIMSSSFSIMEAMGPALSEFADQYGRVISGVIELIAPIFTEHDEGMKRLLEGAKPIITALGDGIMTVMDVLRPYIPLIADLIELIVNAIAALMPFIPPIIDFVMNVLAHALNFLLPIAVVVLGIVAAFKAYTIAVAALNTVMGILRGIMTAVRIATTLFSLALAANPIGLIITAVIALVGALVYFFTQTELGGKIWSGIMDGLKAAWNWVVEAIQWGWENIIQPVWNAIATVARWLFAIVAAVLITPFVMAWNLLSSGIQWAWENVIKPAWDAVAAGASWLWENWLSPIFTWISDKWTWMTTMIEIGVYYLTNVLWPLIQFKFQELYNDWIRPIIDFIVEKWNWLKDKFQEGWNAIRDHVIQPFMDFIRRLWEEYIRPRIDDIMAKWEVLKTVLSLVWDQIRDKVIQPFMDKLTDLKDWFGDTVDNIGKLWDQLKEKMAVPINWAIRHVFNGGILPAWNAVAGLVKLPTLTEMDEISFATGGVMPGYTPGKDVHSFFSPTAGRLNLSGGEAIMRPEWTRAVGGPKAVEQMNREAIRGGRPAEHSHALGGVLDVGSFANGGVLQKNANVNITTEIQRSMERAVAAAFPNQIITSGTRYQDVGSGYDNHMAGRALDFAPSQALASWIQNTYPNSAELFWDAGPNIKNGNPTGAIGGHSDHVHWAMSSMVDPYTGDVVSADGPGGGGGGGFWQSITNTVKRLWDAAIDVVPSFPDMDAFGTFGQVPGNWLKEAATGAWNHIKGLADDIMEWVGGGGGAGSVDTAGITGPIVSQVEEVFARHGFTGQQWEDAKWIIQKESNWDPTAVNPSSGAFGLFQFNPMGGDTLGQYLPDRNPDPAVQADAGARYMKNRYGDPTSARRFWEANNWYDAGGEAAGTGIMQKNVIEPERVLSPNQTRAFNDFIYGFLPTMIDDYRRRPYDINTAVDKLINGWSDIQEDAGKRRDRRIDAMSEDLQSTFEAREAGELKLNPVDANFDRGWIDRNGEKLADNLAEAVSGAQMVSADPWGYLEAEERAKERIEAEKEAAREAAKEEREEAEAKAEEEEDKARQEKEQAELDAAETEEEKEKIREEHEAAREDRQAAQTERDNAANEREQAENDRIQAAKESGEYYYGYKVFGDGASNPNEYEASEHEKEVLNYLDAIAAPLGLSTPMNKVQEKLPVFQELGAAVQTATPAWIAAANGDPSGLQHNIAVSQVAAYEQREAEMRDLGPSALAGVLEMAMSTSATSDQQPFIGELNYQGMSQGEFNQYMDYWQSKQSRQKGGTIRTR